MNKIFISMALLMLSSGAMAQDATVSSPDGKLKLDFNLKGGKPTY